MTVSPHTSASAPDKADAAENGTRWLGKLRASWPPGTAGFALRTWAAMGLALYAAFTFELSCASSAAVSVLILAQPSQGMVLSKAIYRFLGTLFGCAVGLTLTAAFPQDRTMLLATFTLYMAAQTALGSLLRDFRSYGSILAGYTAAIISVANIDAPGTSFDAAINRVAAILISIAAVALTNFFVAGAESSRKLAAALRGALADVRGMAEMTLDRRTSPSAAGCVDMAARLMPLRGEISYAWPEQPDGRARARGARSALLGMFELISAIQAVGHGLQTLRSASLIVDEARVIGKRALRLQSTEQSLVDLRRLARPAVRSGTLTIEEAFVFDRLHFMIRVLGDVRDGMRSLRTGRSPRRNVDLPIHHDGFAIALNWARVVLAVGAVSVLSVLSGWTATAQAVLFTAVFVSLSAVQPDPRVLGKAALFGMPAVAAVSSIYAFFIFPNVEGYPVFIIAMAPVVFVTCWLVNRGLGGAGLIFGAQTIVLTSPANLQTLDPDAFVATATMLVVSGAVIYVATTLLVPVDPRQRRLRLALAVGDALRRALADEGRRPQPRASRHYDRLSQFKTWQRGMAATPARRMTMQRLADLGNLAYAVRRAWRALDAARGLVDAQIETNARRVLPSLDPEPTRQVATEYLEAARGRDREAAFALVHAAAALYGTALLTRFEARLLRRIELLGRTA